MKCSNCNQILPFDSVFCQYCGSKDIMSDTKSDGFNDDFSKSNPSEDEVFTNEVESGQGSYDSLLKPLNSEEKQSEATDVSEKGNGLSHEGNRSESDARYCKMCGGIINKGNKKCESRGKQFYRLPRLKIILPIVFIMLLVSIAANVYQSQQIAESNEALSKVKAELKAVEKETDNLNSQLKRVLDENMELFASKYFMDSYVVIVSDDGTRKYHKYGCEDLDLSYFWVYNVEAAKQDGYRPCKKCRIN